MKGFSVQSIVNLLLRLKTRQQWSILLFMVGVTSIVIYVAIYLPAYTDLQDQQQRLIELSQAVNDYEQQVDVASLKLQYHNLYKFYRSFVAMGQLGNGRCTEFFSCLTQHHLELKTYDPVLQRAILIGSLNHLLRFLFEFEKIGQQRWASLSLRNIRADNTQWPSLYSLEINIKPIDVEGANEDE